jgi:serine/threonine protein kinase
MSYAVLNNKYVLERTLGSGYSCKVKLGRDSDNNYYAIKIFKSASHVEEANVEIEAL